MKRQLISTIFYFSSLAAADFGAQGYTFPISEENIVSYLQKRFEELSTSTLLEKKASIEREAKHQIQMPRGVSHVKEAAQYRSFLFDPSFVLTENIKTLNGEVIATQGTKISPLKKITLSKALLFFDGTNPNHLKWARREPKSHKWVLVEGNPSAIEIMENKRVYFDQNGIYTTKFHIEKIPARVFQEGEFLRIEEIPISNGEEQ